MHEQARNVRCQEAYGLPFKQVCILVLIVARWRCGQMLTTRLEAGAFLRGEEGLNFQDTEAFRVLVGRRLIEPRARQGNKLWYAPTLTGIAKIGRAGQEERAA